MMVVRDGTPADAYACAAIYAPYVAETAISFEAVAPDAAEMARRIQQLSASHAWLVLERDRRVVGYAYGGPFRSRDAYRFACEVTIYLELGLRRAGGGRLLYTALLQRLAVRGYRTAIAVITLPNPASLGLHAALGFRPVGTLEQIGYKHNRWHDVAWAQRPLAA
ncbi:MAG: N-acetyltransferase [Solirubrobacterales bacterium]|nr:N-acetyltransferase [Solirubrobacterales bacterium]